MEAVTVSAVTLDRDKAKITLRRIPDRVGIAAQIFAALAAGGVIVDIVIQNFGSDETTDISFTLPRVERARAIEILGQRIGALYLGGHVQYDDQIAKVSVVGVGMRSHAIVAARMFEVLAGAGINILLISTSEIKISCIVGLEHAERALEALRHSFSVERNTA